jgi:choline dehydrogenase
MHARSRRGFLKGGSALALGLTLPGCGMMYRRVPDPADTLTCTALSTGDEKSHDYIVIGSGAGGGPLAANLAKAGYRVLLLEAGGDPAHDAGGRENLNYSVPVFHGRASEDPLLAWNYFVRHYADPGRARRDSKFVRERDGVLYPRAGTLGGCTAHNAMITIYPHERDWDGMARLLGDDSWSAASMRRYFKRMERCRYAAALDVRNVADHGFDGWLTTEKPDPLLLFKDSKLLRAVGRAVKESFRQGAGDLPGLFDYALDPNDLRVVRAAGEGPFVTPLATLRGRRRGTRDYLREVEASCDGRLVIRTDALVTQILFDADNRATGVAYLVGQGLYRASARPAAEAGGTRYAEARREVILSAGAFNSPQLLKLSGIGPRAELERHGIPVRVDLPGVGRNLQDRYEVGIVSRVKSDFALTRHCGFGDPAVLDDPCLASWREGRGVYATNGAVLGIVKRSRPEEPVPDLFVFGFPGDFRGYYPGYSTKLAQHKDRFTWAVLKAHTRNTAGSVELRSADPRDTPDIDFRYFDEGSDREGVDLDAVARGVQFARDLNRRMGGLVSEEELPGPTVDDDERVKEFARNEAWGHHASCTNAMGPATDPQAVVDGNFRVHGTRGLRVVDASIFPRIPGFFIVSSVYMVSEKATDAILADAAR